MATRSEVWQNIMSGILVSCAVAAVALMWSRRSTSPGNGIASGPPELVADWASVTASGHRLGPSNAAVTIVEFGDFECPVCGAYQAGVLQPFLDANPTSASLIYRHWPLSYH